MATEVEKWGLFEAAFAGPKDGNPFIDVTLDVEFSLGARTFRRPASMTATASTASASCRTRRATGRFAHALERARA